MQDRCPHAIEIGSHKARIASLEKQLSDLENNKIASLEKKIAELTNAAQNNARQVIEDKATQRGFIRGMHVTATLVGYAIIIISLFLAGKVTGGLEALVKFIASFK